MIEAAAREHIEPDSLVRTDRIDFLRSYAFVGVHVLALGTLFTGVGLPAVIALLGHLLGEALRHHRGVPPLLRAPLLPHEPRLPVRPGLARG